VKPTSQRGLGGKLRRFEKAISSFSNEDGMVDREMVAKHYKDEGIFNTNRQRTR
jgi:hypothetical protein